jgi:phosphatidylinositol dimannoside acyltransferase
VRERLTDLAYAAGWAAVKALPEGTARRLFQAGADRAVRRRGRGVRQLEANLRRVVGGPVPPDVLRAAMRSYARYWLETFRLPVMDKDALYAASDRVALGADNLDRAHAAGRGVVLVLPHSANWDIAAVWLVRHGMPFTTVAERLKPESLYERFVAYRESIGMEVLPLTGGARPVSEVLAERLRAGGVVALVGDRDLSRSGVPVTFFGEQATMPPGPALLAIRTGAPLLPAGLWYDGESCVHHIHEPVPIAAAGRLRDRVGAATQAVADVFAADIAEHPADWHMLQRLWLADLDPDRAPHVRVPSGDLGGG